MLTATAQQHIPRAWVGLLRARLHGVWGLSALPGRQLESRSVTGVAGLDEMSHVDHEGVRSLLFWTQMLSTCPQVRSMAVSRIQAFEDCSVHGDLTSDVGGS